MNDDPLDARLTPFLEIYDTIKGPVGFERTNRITGEVVPLDADKAQTTLVKLTGPDLRQALFDNLVMLLEAPKCLRTRLS